MYILAQIHTDLINADQDQNSIESQYYNGIWKKKADDGYWRPEAYWEIPLWMAKVSGILLKNGKSHAKHIVTTDEVTYNKSHGIVMFSVLDSNKHIIKKIINNSPDGAFILGGYIDWSYFDDEYESEAMNLYSRGETIEHWAKRNELKDAPPSYHLFQDEKCIPRLTMSKGCNHMCSFCSIPKGITEIPMSDIMENLTAMCEQLDFELIYIDDKTFGQCRNHRSLEFLGLWIRGMNPAFKGFIVQTTAAMVKKLDLSGLHIFAVEVGVESYNDDILSEYRKPATEHLIKLAAQKLKHEGIKFIPNIIIGMPEETSRTYARTYNFIERYRDDIFSINIYNLAVYDGTELADRVDATEDDKDEMKIKKSFVDEEKHKLDEAFSTMLFSNALTIL